MYVKLDVPLSVRLSSDILTVGENSGVSAQSASEQTKEPSQHVTEYPEPPQTPHSSRMFPEQSQSPTGMPAPPHTPHSSIKVPSQSHSPAAKYIQCVPSSNVAVES